MPAERTTMRQVREIVRLHQAGVSTRQIGILYRPRLVRHRVGAYAASAAG